MDYLDLIGIKPLYKKISAEEYLKLNSIKKRNYIFIPPTLEDDHFGYFQIEDHNNFYFTW